MLDWYARQWQGRALHDDELVISAHEKTCIPARRRQPSTRPGGPRTPLHVEHGYFRCGAWTYLAALDVPHATIFGRCQASNGIVPLDRLVEQVITPPPDNGAPCFWDCRSLFRSPGCQSREALAELSIRACSCYTPRAC